jgi:hypothetical protein
MDAEHIGFNFDYSRRHACLSQNKINDEANEVGKRCVYARWQRAIPSRLAQKTMRIMGSGIRDASVVCAARFCVAKADVASKRRRPDVRITLSKTL